MQNIRIDGLENFDQFEYISSPQSQGFIPASIMISQLLRLGAKNILIAKIAVCHFFHLVSTHAPIDRPSQMSDKSPRPRLSKRRR
jgi:hypothetical protein